MKYLRAESLIVAVVISLPSAAGTGPPSNDFPRQAHFRIDRPGILMSWPKNGEPLPPGTYRYRFTLRQLPGHLPGMLASANDTVRLEVYDATRGERIASRVIQQNDLGVWKRDGGQKHSVVFSTWGRSAHRFKARLYWPGLTGVSVESIERENLGSFSPSDLAKKASRLERVMEKEFVDPDGFVIVRNAKGEPDDYGDTALWTGYYVASLAWKIRVTQDALARAQLERSLWALHRLHAASPVRGTLLRHAAPSGLQLLSPSASRDTYTGFYVGVAQGLPYVKNPALAQALRSDLDAVTGHLLDHHWRWVPQDGPPLDLRNTITDDHIEAFIQLLTRKPTLRSKIETGFRLMRWYFKLQSLRWPEALLSLEKALRHSDLKALPRLLPAALPAFREALYEMRRGIDRSAAVARGYGLAASPYQKLDRWLDLALAQLSPDVSRRVFPTQSLHALHALKVAGELLPRPNRYEQAYQDHLRQGAGFLKTVEAWALMDSALFEAVRGQTRANVERGTGGHLSPFLLYNLIQLEKNADVRMVYRLLQTRDAALREQDLNAFMEILGRATQPRPEVPGLALWVLSRYPEDRQGRGPLRKRDERALADDWGGWVNGKSREALPPDLRPRDAFLWQRNPHSLDGDLSGWRYPPLDYLVAYWLARVTGNTITPS